ncbi:MAG: hypothetical protein ACLP8S_09515 [Solirubrobacteraceae bacterium]
MDARTVQRAPAGAPEAGGRVPARREQHRLRDRLNKSPLLLWWGVSLLAAVLTAIVWPTVPSYDPFSWVVWGRELTDPHLSFYVGNGPSWKPLPMVFTSIYGAFGAAAPTLWVITARTGGIAGLIGAYRLAAVLCNRAGLARFAWVAGLFAALGIVLTQDWAYYFFRGTSETLLIGVMLWALDRLIAGHHWQAYMLGAAEGLMRPEVWPFLLLYGAWLFYKQPGMRVWVVLGLVVQPVGWFLPPWISTGAPFMAATHASLYNGHLGADWLSTVLGRGEGLQSLPSAGFAVLAVGLALWRGRDRIVLAMAAFVIAWWLVVVVETWDGYPGLERFYLPAAAVTCVLSGLGLVRSAAVAGELLTGSWARLRGGTPHAADRQRPDAHGAGVSARTAVTVSIGVVLLVGSLHYMSGRISLARAQEPLAAIAVTRFDQLGQAVSAAGGRDAVLPCKSSLVTINHSMQPMLAWQLHTTLERVKSVLPAPGVAFVGPPGPVDGGVPPIREAFRVHKLIKVAGAWKVFQVYLPGPTPRCVGR